MSDAKRFREQAAQAEHLADKAFDRLTIERLKTFAPDCHAKAALSEADIGNNSAINSSETGA